MKKIILLSGGGTMGSVSPLLAVAETLVDTGVEFIWVGTKTGPEKSVVRQARIPFHWIFAGKFRRYLSLKTITDPILILLGFFQSLYLLIRFRPVVVLTCGSFVSVPLAYAAWLCRIPVFLHQQDLEVGLANKLMKPISSVVTVVFEEMKSFFEGGGRDVVVSGHPIRVQILEAQKKEALTHFGWDDTKPVVFFTGGGTGAQALNQLVQHALSLLLKDFYVLHTTGKGKESVQGTSEGYIRSEFFSGKDMGLAYAASAVVVTRAGASALCEVSALGKPTVVIPIPHSHQEENAQFFAKKFGFRVVEQKRMTPKTFYTQIKETMEEKKVTKSDFAKSAKIVAEYVKRYL